MGSDEEVLVIEKAAGLARVMLNRPHRLNALNKPLMRALRECFRELGDDRDVRVIHLSGAGEKAFCVGADLKEPDTHEYSDLRQFLADQPGIFDLMARCPQIIVCEVNGWAVGGGLQLALFSDLVFASAGATFQLPQVSLGLIPPYGTTVRLARHIGHGRAMQMLLLGTKLGAQQALDCGLVQELTEDAESLRARIEEVLQELLAMPPESLLLAKDSLTTGWDMGSEGAARADRFRAYALKQTAETKQIHATWRSSMTD